MTRYVLYIDVPANAIEADEILASASVRRDGITITDSKRRSMDVDLVGVQRSRPTSSGLEVSEITKPPVLQ